ncbi:unnamed protein product [Parascedosporium putredinis]|uniref:Uncharacterized protein n=1 Tax=Parascedosporium putredinis TaxID=1442378 RepID=A0A9P1MF08_9PEZI|nr:unnamed protein product [Parascedosporium putredinis]CAI8001471.1 unnamed protein product [Parascedosporium putredinis]
MRFLFAFAVGALVGTTIAEDSTCPTITSRQVAPTCSPGCPEAPDCRFISTVTNPCGCPRAVAEATLIQPCNVGSESAGEGRPTRTSGEVESTTTRTTATRSVTSDLGDEDNGEPQTTRCPRMTRTVSAEGCVALACPTPNCIFQEPFMIPCGCPDPETVLVDGCVTECVAGCATTTVKVTDACSTQQATVTLTRTSVRMTSEVEEVEEVEMGPTEPARKTAE